VAGVYRLTPANSPGYSLIMSPDAIDEHSTDYFTGYFVFCLRYVLYYLVRRAIAPNAYGFL
jgi:hypothetical protein